MTLSVRNLVNVAYGEDADLFKDVLKVPRNASKEEIQSAFIDRRCELYEMLQNSSQCNTSGISLNESNGSATSFTSERHLTEKKMDALVATFRTLYDPAKRHEYNSSLNIIPSKPLSTSDQDLPTNSLFTSSMSSDQMETNAHQSYKQKSQSVNSINSAKNTSQNGSSKVTKRGLAKIPLGSRSTNSNREISENKRKSKRKNKGIHKQNPSTSIQSTKLGLSSNENVNQSNVEVRKPTLRETFERITKEAEDIPIQQELYHQVKDNKKSKKKRTGKKDGNIEENRSHFQNEENIPIENLNSKSRSRGQVTWKDNDDLDSTKDDALSTSNVYSGCLDLEIRERPIDEDDSGSFVGFLRSTGFEHQAHLLQELNNEVKGSISDTLLAIDQVVKAFKIADDDIDAVVGNIHQERSCLVQHIRRRK